MPTAGLTAGPGTLFGTVDFYDGDFSHLLGAASLNGSDQAILQANSLSPTGGTSPHTIIAVYVGNTDYNGSQTSGASNVSQQIEFGDTTTVTASPNPLTYGVGPSLTITATVTTAANTPPGNPLNGTVTFFDGTTQLGSPVNVVNGQATVTLPNNQLSPGPHNLTATFSDANTSAPFYITSTSSPYQEAVLSQTTTTLSASTNGQPAGFGATVTFTATVAASTGTPSDGSVQFFVDGNAVGSPAAVSGGIATFATSSLGLTLSPTPAHQITATYLGDGTTYAASSASAISQAVYYNDSISVTATPGTTGVGVPTTLTAVVTPVGTSNLPTGTVTFYSGGVQIGSPVNLGASGQTSQATLVWTFTPAGTYTVTAAYNPTTSPQQLFISNASTPTTVTVLDTTATTLNVSSSTGQPYDFGQAVTLSATVNVTSGSQPTATGTVTFEYTLAQTPCRSARR